MSEHEIEWLSPNGSPAPLRGEKSVESTVSHLPETRRAVRIKAYQLAAEASGKLAGHHKTGSAYINVTEAPPRKLDSWVELKDADPGGKGRGGKNKRDRSAMSIEFGWTQTHAFGKKLDKPIHHDGLHILGGVMNRAVSRYRGG